MGSESSEATDLKMDGVVMVPDRPAAQSAEIIAKVTPHWPRGGGVGARNAYFAFVLGPRAVAHQSTGLVVIKAGLVVM